MQTGNREHAIDLSNLTSRSRAGPLLLEEEDATGSKCCIFRIPNGEHAADGSNLTARSSSGILLLKEEDTLRSKCCIFRIPGMLKMQNEQAYTPYRFSFGPWHNGKTQLMRNAEEFKKAFLKGLINRFPNPAAKEEELEAVIKEAHSKAKECYEGEDVYEGVTAAAKAKFENIVLLDGCFIIELFRKAAGEKTKFLGLCLSSCLRGPESLKARLLWLNLQLNSATLLFHRINLIPAGQPEKKKKKKQPQIPAGEPEEKTPKILAELLSSSSKIVHLIDFARRYLGYSSEEGVPSLQCRNTTFPSATRLKEAGVKFKKVKSGIKLKKAESGSILDVRFNKDNTESRNILDVRFNKDKGVLEIPSLLINPLTETIFRNLISFEQCNPLYMPKVACYAMLLDCLVDTSDDVDLMSRAGIFCNWLNPEEAAKFLSGMRNGTSIDVFFYDRLCEDVNDYCQKWWPKWRVSLIHNYFTKPWAIVSVIFAIIVLFFTIMSVFYK